MPKSGEIKPYRGRPTIHVNGTPMTPDIYALTHATGARWSWEEVPQHNVRNFYDIGFRLFQLDFWLSDIWPKDGSPLDVSLAQKQIRGVLDVAPDACIILRVHTDAPYWWNEANRDQCTEYADGPIQEYYKPGPPHNNEDFSIMRSLRASLASQKWKQEAGEKLVEFCKKLSQTEEGDAVIGMHISGGIYGEWHYWGFVDHDPDTGKAMTAYFRNWLRNKYGTDKKLQQAWNSAQWTLETATVPGVEERTKTQFGQFKDPKAERRVIDYTAAQQEAVVEDIEYFCRLAKESWPRPLITGQRVIDTMFPLAKGGAAAIPGGFGTGKTMTQHQIAKWCDADIIIYVGCGERGNEMTQALQEFSELVDPRTGKSLMDRTVLIANTSNMPVAAREASIYTGITLAEYYRDMGYHAAMMADSTSRWAEALREISGRLEEMPADEGYPAYLPSRLAEFYERAGYVRTLNGAEGSVSVIGAVSPQGNDFSEPVTQNTKRFTRCFWALDKSLAYARHYPAINWNDSYSEYLGDLGGWYYDNVGHDFMSCRERIANLLLQENNLMQIVKLIGSDVLPDDQKLTIEIARVIRVGFLQQNAFHAVDTYVPLEKQLKMMETILYLYDKCAALVAKQVPVSRLLATGLFDELVQMKYTVPNDDLSKLDELQKAIDTKLAAVAQG